MTGVDVIVIQKALEFFGDYEHDPEKRYGIWDADTDEAARNRMALLTNGDTFDECSYNHLLNASTVSQRTYDAIKMLRNFNLQHRKVQEHCLASLTMGGNMAAIETRIYYNTNNISDRRYGRADLLACNSTTSTYIWEVKHNTPANISKGIVQLQGYVDGAQNGPNQTGLINKGFSSNVITGMPIFPKTAIPWNDNYLLYYSHNGATNYHNALILYEEVNSVPNDFVLVHEPVAVELTANAKSNSFSLESVFNAVTDFGQGVVDSLSIDSETGQMFVQVVVGGLTVIMLFTVFMGMVVVF